MTNIDLGGCEKSLRQSNNLIKLNLNSCQNNKIYLIIPAIDVNNIDILNKSNAYYNYYIVTSDNLRKTNGFFIDKSFLESIYNSKMQMMMRNMRKKMKLVYKYIQLY